MGRSQDFFWRQACSKQFPKPSAQNPRKPGAHICHSFKHERAIRKAVNECNCNGRKRL